MKQPFHRVLTYLVVLLFSSLACGGNVSTSTQPVAVKPTPTDTSQLFYDDFSNTSGKWGRVWDSADGSSVGYENGGYQIVVNKPQNISWGVTGSNSFEGDAVIETDVIKQGGAEDAFFGIICRDDKVNGQEHMYFMILSGNGTASINKFSDNSVTSLSSAQVDPITAINEGNTFHLRADCVGNMLSLYVNDQQIITATDDSFSSGDAGLIAGAGDTPGTNILFDNFSVHHP